ncbi:MAG: GAF domain-containing sensor histidine kinase [Chloroflexota bacterium]
MANSLQNVLTQPDRLEALQRTQLLDTPAEDAFDRLTQLASTILKAPKAMVTLVEPHRQFHKSQIGLDLPSREAPIERSFCKHVVATHEPLIIEDATEHPLVCDNPAVLNKDVVAYLGIPLTTSDGYTLGSLCVIDDIPRHWTNEQITIMKTLAASVMSEIELRMAIDKRDQLLERLQARNEELDAFSYTVSHNLKNAVGAIMGWAEISTRYQERISRNELLENMGKIIRLADDTNDVIHALLLLSNIDRADDIEVTPLDMESVLQDAIIRLEPQIARSKAQLHLPDKFPKVVGYPEWVTEIWANYLSNALKYGGKPPQITIGAHASDNKMVHFWVQDNGAGIDPTKIDELFTTFSRLPETANIEGHGLGLSIVERITTRLGGTVHAESKRGEGSTFSFTLPAAP